jgi:hypothetical protein
LTLGYGCFAHFRLTSFDWTFPFCTFLRRFGNLVAGFLTIRRSFFGIACLPLDQVGLLPPPRRNSTSESANLLDYCDELGFDINNQVSVIADEQGNGLVAYRRNNL